MLTLSSVPILCRRLAYKKAVRSSQYAEMAKEVVLPFINSRIRDAILTTQIDNAHGIPGLLQYSNLLFGGYVSSHSCAPMTGTQLSTESFPGEASVHAE
ncbi:hypothetical protein SDC9_12461 [bioreactor metagenome]|uniref:Uncharacterized protein n=1 Tax=bioreactor metagenome TaxID=1076179 RepID=A0A644TIP3_9ZZZZ|nr:hypothetical protein [uncultured Desulfovibrio sp.]